MPDSQDNIAFVKTFLTLMGDKKFDEGVACVAEDCAYHNMPLGMDTVTGPAGVRAVLEPFFAPTLRNEFVFLSEAVAGPTVFIERVDRHQLAEDRWVELPVTGVFTLENGKIKAWKDYFDLPTIVTAWPELAG